ERILNKDVLDMMGWGNRKAKDITRRDIVQMLDKIIERGAPIQANRTFSVVRKMFKFAISRDIITTSPCTAVIAPSIETPRNRALTDEEIRKFWHGLDRASLSEPTEIAL